MANARLDFRLDAKIKSKVEKASALSGVNSLTEYVVRVLDRDASRVIEQHESMSLKGDIFDRFTAACDESSAPNKALRDAKSFTDKHDIT
jgi:uncharacterized protein (DUF1778 family)